MNIDDVVAGQYYAIAAKIAGWGTTQYSVTRGLAVRRVNAPKDKKRRAGSPYSFSYNPRKTDYWQFDTDKKHKYNSSKIVLTRMAKRILCPWEEYEKMIQNSAQELEVIKDLVEDKGLARDRITCIKVAPNKPAIYNIAGLSFEEVSKVLGR
jgi:hypothetical protein